MKLQNIYYLLISCLLIIMSCSSASKNPGMFINEGLKHDQQNEYDKALEFYTKAIELDSKNLKAYSLRGHVYDKKGQPELAILDYNKVIAIDPNNAITYYYRAFSYLAKPSVGKSNPKKAVKDFTKALELGLDAPDIYYHRGVAYSKLGKKAKAISDYKKLISLSKYTKESLVKKAKENIKKLEQDTK